MTDFGNVPVHDIRTNCRSINDTFFNDCLEFNDIDPTLGSGFVFELSPLPDPQLNCTTHAGLVCEGMQIM